MLPACCNALPNMSSSACSARRTVRALHGSVDRAQPQGHGDPHPEDDSDFLRRQVLTSRNVSGDALMDASLGGRSHQIEHHLLPSSRPDLTSSAAGPCRRDRPTGRACPVRGGPRAGGARSGRPRSTRSSRCRAIGQRQAAVTRPTCPDRGASHPNCRTATRRSSVRVPPRGGPGGKRGSARLVEWGSLPGTTPRP